MFVHMSPGALVTNICHFKKVWIQTCFADSFPEKRFVSSGSTGCNYNSIEIMFFDTFFDRVHTILRTGIQQVFRVFHICDISGIFSYIFHIHNSGNINTAMTHKNSYSRSFSKNIFFYYFLFLQFLSFQFKIFGSFRNCTGS